LDQIALQKLLAHPAEWIAEEREELLAVERAVTQTTSVLDERTRNSPSTSSSDRLTNPWII